MEVFNLFPTPVGKFNLGREFSHLELQFINHCQQRKNEGNTTSTETYVLDLPLFQDLREFVSVSMNSFFKEIYQPKDVDLYITQSWLNYTDNGQFHHKHSHSNSFLSGVLYINADESTDKIHFFNEDYKRIEIAANEFNMWNSASWWLPAKTGVMYIFNSSLYHMVSTVNSPDTRISLAFNTFVKGYLGKEISLTGLKL